MFFQLEGAVKSREETAKFAGGQGQMSSSSFCLWIEDQLRTAVGILLDWCK